MGAPQSTRPSSSRPARATWAGPSATRSTPARRRATARGDRPRQWPTAFTPWRQDPALDDVHDALPHRWLAGDYRLMYHGRHLAHERVHCVLPLGAGYEGAPMNSRLAAQLSISFSAALALLFTGCSSDGGVNRTVGAECTTDQDCDEQCLDGISSGFCTISCLGHSDCPSGTVCGDTQGGVCLFTCENHGDCTSLLGDAYGCEDETDFDSETIWVCLDN
jgi:hypothetical protein